VDLNVSRVPQRLLDSFPGHVHPVLPPFPSEFRPPGREPCVLDRQVKVLTRPTLFGNPKPSELDVPPLFNTSKNFFR